MVVLAPDHIIVRLLLIVICSVYVPGSTFIILPGVAAFIAACIVGKSVGTVITEAALDICRDVVGKIRRATIVANIGRVRTFFNANPLI